MFIRFVCPRCGKSIKVPADAAGLRGQCPRCRATVAVPGSATDALLRERSMPMPVIDYPATVVACPADDAGPADEAGVAEAVPDALAYEPIGTPEDAPVETPDAEWDEGRPADGVDDAAVLDDLGSAAAGPPTSGGRHRPSRREQARRRAVRTQAIFMALSILAPTPVAIYVFQRLKQQRQEQQQPAEPDLSAGPEPQRRRRPAATSDRPGRPAVAPGFAR